MVMKAKIRQKIFDWIVVIFEITYSIAIPMHIFFITPIVKGMMALMFFSLFSHVIRFGFRFSIFSIKLRNWPLFLLILILLLDIFQAALLGDLNKTGYVGCLLLNNIFFLSYLNNLLREKREFDYALEPYLGYSLYNIFVIVIVTFLILAGFPWESNMLTDDIRVLEEDMAGGATYYFPYFLSIAADYHPIRIFGQLPGLSGLSHEPHIIMWIITPAVIMGFTNIKHKLIKTILIFVYIFIAVNSMSSMNLVCVLILVTFQAIWMTARSHNIWNLLFLTLLITLILFVFNEILDTVFLQVISKFESSGSKDYTSDMLKYIISFKGLFGYGNFPPSSGQYAVGESAGIITGLLDITLYVVLIYRSFILSISGEVKKHYLGLGFMYFLLHGLKLNYMLIIYPFFTYMIFLLCITTDRKYAIR